MKKTKEVRIQVGPYSFVTELRVVRVSAATGKQLVSAESIARFEKAVAAWVLKHGADGPDSLKVLRSAAGLSASQLAALLDVDRARIFEWESGRAQPGRALFATVASLARDAIAGRSETADYLRAMHEPKDGKEIRLAV